MQQGVTLDETGGLNEESQRKLEEVWIFFLHYFFLLLVQVMFLSSPTRVMSGKEQDLISSVDARIRGNKLWTFNVISLIHLTR